MESWQPCTPEERVVLLHIDLPAIDMCSVTGGAKRNRGAQTVKIILLFQVPNW